MVWHENRGPGATPLDANDSLRNRTHEGQVRPRDPNLPDEFAVARLVERVRKRVQPWWSAFSPPLRVTFPVADTARPIAHRLAAVPTGYVLVYSDGEVHATPNQPWDREYAYLQAATANAHAIVIFFTLLEDWVDA